MSFFMLLVTLLWVAYLFSAISLSVITSRRVSPQEVNLGWLIVLSGMVAHFGIMLLARDTRSPALVIGTMVAVVVANVVVVIRVASYPKSPPEPDNQK